MKTKNAINHSIVYLIVSILLCACQPKEKVKTVETKTEFSPPEYASKFKLSATSITVTEPWPGATKEKSYPLENVPERVIVTSTTHLPYLEYLGVADKLVGFPGTSYISSSVFRKKVATGEIIDIGNDGNMNLELVIGLQPDVVIAFDMGNESTVLDKIEESGIPVIYNADFMETSALGRAEWIKFFGALFDKKTAADSIFKKISSNYDSLKNLTANVQYRPSVFSGVMYGDTWFLPGGKNWSAEFYRDAGAEYIWAADSSNGWLEIGFESVFDKAWKADYWVGISTLNTREELINQDNRYGDFQAFKNSGIFTYNKRINPSGGYDFFESGYARPDLVLADLIYIFHPEIITQYETYYFQQVQ